MLKPICTNTYTYTFIILKPKKIALSRCAQCMYSRVLVHAPASRRVRAFLRMVLCMSSSVCLSPFFASSFLFSFCLFLSLSLCVYSLSHSHSPFSPPVYFCCTCTLSVVSFSSRSPFLLSPPNCLVRKLTEDLGLYLVCVCE